MVCIPGSRGQNVPKKKVAIALSEWLLDELDSEADSSKRSRSALVEEAVTRYVVERKTRAQEEAFRENVGNALVDMRAFAEEVAADPDARQEPSSLEKLRAIRGEQP
jgi:predicted transcriptional regulator